MMDTVVDVAKHMLYNLFLTASLRIDYYDPHLPMKTLVAVRRNDLPRIMQSASSKSEFESQV